MDEKRDINNHAQMYENYKKRLFKDEEIGQKNRETILQYLRDSELGKTIKKGQKRKIGAARNIKVAGLLKSLDAWFEHKDFKEITSKEMEDFILKLNAGKIKNSYNKPYASESLMSIKKLIRKFWKTLKGNNQTYPDEVEWIDTSGKIAEIKSLPKLMKDVQKMADFSNSHDKKALILALGDGGYREEELLNVRLGHISILDEKEHPDILVTRIHHSKTMARSVSLPLASTAVKAWIAIHPEKDNQQAFLFPKGKAWLYKTVVRTAEKGLSIHCTPHMLRHTSATYYAPLLDRATFCRRFGWSFSSRSPDRYIDWANVEEKKTSKIFKATRQEELETEISKLQSQMGALLENLNRREQVDTVLNEVMLDKRVQQVLTEKILSSKTKVP